MKNRFFIIFAIIAAAAIVYQFFSNYPTSDQIKNKMESIIINPDLCSASNTEMTRLLKLIKSESQNLHLKEKINAMPKRIDYYIKDDNGKTVAELAYRVDGGCQGVSITKTIR